MIYYKFKISLLVALVVMLVGCTAKVSNKTENVQETVSKMEDQILFIGTYTEKEAHVDGKAEGIYVYKFNSETGELSYVSTSPFTTNPSYLVVHPSKEFLYAVNETGEAESNVSGSVSAFKIDPETSKLSFINQVSSGGDWPCHISIDNTGRYALVANYGGSVSMFPLLKDGSLDEASSIIEHSGSGPTDRQKGPHAHMIIPDFDNRFIYAVDLGADKIFNYRIDTTSQALISSGIDTGLSPGTGPRHMAFHPQMKIAYVINELSGSIDVFNILETGALEQFQNISTLEVDSDMEGACADIQIHPSGNYLYASNRGKVNSIAIYDISKQDGRLRLKGHQSTKGDGPRSFVIDPTGTFLLVGNQNTSNIFTFRIDRNTGLLHDESVETKIPTPVCLKFLSQP